MSIRWMTQVWDRTELEGSELLLMLALADHANDDGVCWPSIPRLASRARISERQTQRLIRKLAQAGYLKVVERGNGRGFTHAYVLLEKGDITMSPITGEKGDMVASPIPEKRVTSSAKRVTFGANKGDIAMSPDPIEPSIESPMREAQAPALAHAAPKKEKKMDASCACPEPQGGVSTGSLRLGARRPLPPASGHGRERSPRAWSAAASLYCQITGLEPNEEQEPDIDATVTDLRLWECCIRTWRKRGHRKENVDGMLDWYRKGGAPDHHGPSRSETRKFNGNAEHRPNLGKHGYDPGDQATIERAIRELQAKKSQRAPSTSCVSTSLQVPDL